MKAFLASIAIVAGLTGAASAQEQRASIAGVVRDASGGVLPGATVIASTGNGLAVPAETDESGSYRFHSLPPGEFEVTAHLAGFAPARVENVDLRLGQELRVPITLTVATLSDSIRVVAESPTIAVTQSARTMSLRLDEIQDLPNGRAFTDVVNQVSGANNEPTRAFGLTMIDGSSASENRFIVDGVETTDLVWGIQGAPGERTMATDFFEEVQVKSSGYTAEYGGSTGGVVNTLTRSGTNIWQGDALLYWQDDLLDAGNRPTLRVDPNDSTRAEYVTYPRDEYRALEPGFTLGGPIIGDTLWFFGGYIPLFEPTWRTAPFADGTTATLRQYRTSHQALVNVTGQLGPRWRFRAGFNAARTKLDGLLPDQDGTSAPDADYDEAESHPTRSLSGSVDWMPNPQYFMTFRVGYWHRDLYREGTYQGDLVSWATPSTGLSGVPPEFQRPLGYSNVPNNWGLDRAEEGRLTLQWDNTFFFAGAGSHQLKAGVQIDRRTHGALLGTTGNVTWLFWDQASQGSRGDYGYYVVQSNPIYPNRGYIEYGEGQSTNLGLFVQDSWTVGRRLTLNLGLRVEDESVPSFATDPEIPATAIKFGFGDKLAPRLGFAWDVTGDGRTKLYGSWGVFYDTMKFRLPWVFASTYDGYLSYTLDDPDISKIVDNDACPPECPGTLFEEFFPPWASGSAINDPNDPKVDPALEPVKLQEAVVGVEREVFNDVNVSVRYIHKQLDRMVEDTGIRLEDGERVFRITNPGFGIAASFVPQGGAEAVARPRAQRNYDAAEVGIQKRFSNGWSGRFFYLWSRLHGTTGGLSETDFFQVGPNLGANSDTPLMSFDETGQPIYGPLATDRPHQIKTQFVYDFSFGTTVGASWFGASGIPRTRALDIGPADAAWPVFYRGRESDGRMPFTSQLDLSLQQRFDLGDRTQLTLMATVFNVLNQDRATDYAQREQFGNQYLNVGEAQYLAGIDTQALIEEQGMTRDPRFLLDERFQAPRTIRLGMRLAF